MRKAVAGLFIFGLIVLALIFIFRKNEKHPVTKESDTEVASPDSGVGGPEGDRNGKTDQAKHTSQEKSRPPAGASSRGVAAVPKQNSDFLSQAQSWSIIRDGEKMKFFAGGSYRIDGGAEGLSNFLTHEAQSLFGVDARNLRHQGTRQHDLTTLVYRQVADEKAIFGATLVIMMKGDAIVQIQNDLIPESTLKDRAPVKMSPDLICRESALGCQGPAKEMWYASRGTLIPAYVLSAKPEARDPFNYIVSAQDGHVIKRLRNAID